MLTKTLVVAAALAALSGAAYADGQTYRGGPKSGVWGPAGTIETGKPYAQYVPSAQTNGNRHVYQGGPQTMVPHVGGNGSR